jgi:hypothetical protein
MVTGALVTNQTASRVRIFVDQTTPFSLPEKQFSAGTRKGGNAVLQGIHFLGRKPAALKRLESLISNSNLDYLFHLLHLFHLRV